MHGWDHLICQHISTMKSSKGSQSGPAILSLVLSGNWGNDAISSVNPGSINYRLSWFIRMVLPITSDHLILQGYSPNSRLGLGSRVDMPRQVEALKGMDHLTYIQVPGPSNAAFCCYQLLLPKSNNPHRLVYFLPTCDVNCHYFFLKISR